MGCGIVASAGGAGEGFRSAIAGNLMSWARTSCLSLAAAPAVSGSFNSMHEYYLTYRDYQTSARLYRRERRRAYPPTSDIRAVSDFFQSSGSLMGVPASFNQLRYIAMTDGRWLNDLDDSQKRSVVVLGDESRRLLFRDARRSQHHLLNG